MQLMETLGETGTIVMVKPGVMVAAFAPQTFDSQGNLIDPEIRGVLRMHLEEFSKWILKVSTPREFIRFACEMDVQLAHS